MVEHRAHNPGNTGSTPVLPTNLLKWYLIQVYINLTGGQAG